MPIFPEHGLYCITDSRLAGDLSHVEQARLCLEGGAAIIQFRDKTRSGQDLLDDAREIAALCQAHDAVFIVNDDPQLAVDANVIAVFTEWPEFAKIDLAAMAAVARSGAVVVDTRNLLEPDLVRQAGLEYDGVGRR